MESTLEPGCFGHSPLRTPDARTHGLAHNLRFVEVQTGPVGNYRKATLDVKFGGVIGGRSDALRTARGFRPTTKRVQ